MPRQIDPSGPASIADVASCTGMDEYDSVDAALDDIGRCATVIVRVAELGADVIERADRVRIIAKHGAGLDTVDNDAASRLVVV